MATFYKVESCQVRFNFTTQFFLKTADPVSAAEIIKQYKSKAIKMQSGLKAKV